MKLDFGGKTVLVTGGAQGIGRQIAALFAQCGGRVAVADLHFEEAGKQALLDEGVMQFHPLDVSDAAQVKEVFALVESSMGTIDVLVNNAGIYPNCDFFDMTPEVWQQTLDIDLNSVFFCTQEAALQMKKSPTGGSIVNITTIDAFLPSWGHAHYCAAKAGVYSLTRACANSLGQYGIRVNAVAPGLIDRPTLKTDWPDGYNRYMDKAPIKTIPNGDDIAYACAFLASDFARAISGTEIPVESGILASAPY